MKKLFTILMAALSLASCTSQKKAENATKQKMLVLYYSQTGTTKAVAEEIKAQTGADIEAIEVETPYDGTFQQTVERCTKEMKDGETPVMKPLKADLSQYDVIFIGYPIWCGTYAQPIASLVKNETFEGKTIVTFCTFGSGGLQSSTKNLAAALPKATVKEGYGVRTVRLSAVKDEVTRFLVKNGFDVSGANGKAPELEDIPPYGEHKPVGEAETEIFNKACSSYQFPLGTPVDVAQTETSQNYYYEFTAKSQGPDGKESTSTIYVVKAKKEGAVPEFTEVVR